MDAAAETVDPLLQRTVRRRRAFFALPVAAVSVAATLLLWETVRLNVPAGAATGRPWRLRILDLESAATIVTFLGLFLITRAQYAQTVRPAIGWQMRRNSRRGGHALRGRGDVLEIAVHNGGGTAVITKYEYRLACSKSPRSSLSSARRRNAGAARAEGAGSERTRNAGCARSRDSARSAHPPKPPVSGSERGDTRGERGQRVATPATTAMPWGLPSPPPGHSWTQTRPGGSRVASPKKRRICSRVRPWAAETSVRR